MVRLSSSTESGGAIYTSNVKLSITNSVFESNSAWVQGGALELHCDSQERCSYNISNTVFRNNSAPLKGGGIFYNMVPPVLRNVTLTENRAYYGPDLACYGIAIVKLCAQSASIISGQTIDDLIFSLSDPYDQRVVSDNSSTASISIDPAWKGGNAVVQGTTEVVATQGLFNFSSVSVIGYFNSTPRLLVQSSGVVSANFQLLERDLKIAIINKTVVNSRILKCQLGQIYSNRACITCERGKYTLGYNGTKCEKCPSEAVDCPHGYQINLQPGYWRSSNASSSIFPCPISSSCLGGTQVNCSWGYKGNLCFDCIAGYSKIWGTNCVQCPSPVENTLRLSGIFLLFVVYILVIIRSSIKTQEKKFGQDDSVQRTSLKDMESDVLIRIFTNYLQMVGILNEFGLQNLPAI